MNPPEMQRKAPPQTQRTRNRTSSTRRVNKMVISEEQMKLPSTKKAEPPTWAQLKKLAQLAEKSLENTRVTQTPENMLLAAFVIVSTVLQCDWNTSDFCITPGAKNESEHHWDMVRCHLQGREDNLTLDVSKLKEQIFETSKAQ
ncbi:endogenous retrovirus group K member 113 Env polyprotein-like isoform X1 [Pongo pygmaeus]|uniref:endogenous retrovirus group K member 113 Env polyprotein-like isoform X1 n=1 Tax=Pongo pygmaeus TaxID=9600 RepID=UPI0023E0CAAA|nr:endogenous retrovirus group K member 113 Env polyprotein-like isoform X1 [Pongo pygmaeus]